MADASKVSNVLEEAVAGYGNEEIPLASYAALIGVFNAGLAASLLLAKASGRDFPGRLDWSDLALFGIATHRLSRLLAKDKVTAALRAPFTEYEEKGGPAEVEEKARGTGARRAIGELVLCPYCLDQWVAAGFVSGSLFAPRLSRLLAGIFATVAIADFLQIAYKASQEKL
jgi:hypothetical protein